ncbi:hypothetical protein Y032_0096g2913 [Ancylostoma ceylanicum]|uniref:Uncharacterized protein n=1 Tax=Ancylostoma ceylanicum TaxID=53326 RepID=A0A016TKG6_9BILA|nr:hypothetical protein Y032_0096g2913 [Ancylostoma ceylanicum]
MELGVILMISLEKQHMLNLPIKRNLCRFPLRLYLRTVIVFASKVHAVAMEILVNLIYRWKIRSGDTEKKEFWPGEKHEGLFFS